MTYNNTHDINITIRYIGNNFGTVPCITVPGANNIATDESNRTVIIDTWVRTKTGIIPEPIVMHRRTIQKP